MKKKVIVLLVLAGILALAAIYRFIQVLPYPMGGGRSQESPDKQFTAHASSLTDRYFFGGERRYYKFTIEAGPRRQVRRLIIDAPPEGMIGWREEGAIQWAADGSAVTYSFKDTQLILTNQP
jgi:hypothetical protein